ncbi:hypothetical protein RYH80_01675 [Halobaculum sp. MBLA0147]|uniref:hypothetical protein n=1 Tax=Halobaculum sp. MBLA0147 TaxID=3079934 RepID=UPI0035231F10
MSDSRTMDEWLIRYLIVGTIGSVAALAVLYGLTLGGSMTAAGGGAVALLLVTLVVVRDLQRYRTV